MTIQIPDDLARGLEGIAAAQQKSVEQVALDSLRCLLTERLPLWLFCGRFGSCLIQALRRSMILRPRLPRHDCRCAIRAPSTGGHPSDLSPRHQRNQRFDEGCATNRVLDGRA